MYHKLEFLRVQGTRGTYEKQRILEAFRHMWVTGIPLPWELYC